MPSGPAQEGDVRVHPIPAVEPSPRFAARVAAGIFAGEALILTAVALLSSRSDGLGGGRVAIPAVCALVALLLYAYASEVTPRVLQATIVLGTVLVSVHALAASREPALSGEMLYVWLGLYAAYFFSPRHAAAQLAFMAGAYLAVLLVNTPPDAVAAGWLTLVGILFPAAGVLRAVRDGVTQLVNRLSEAAHTDTLTGLKNRLALDRELHAEVERALRAGERLSVVIGDLDFFKSVNDRLGHRAGDEALVRAGQVLMRYRRAADSIARTGGEEFTILLPGASEHEAYLASERMRAAVEHEFRGHPAALTFSFGIATYPDHGRSADSVLEAADQALYAAKALGRNRCVIFSAEISAIFAPEAGRGADEVQIATLLSLAEALDLRDTGTADHSRTVGRYCGLIAAELGLPLERVRRIEVAGILHDIGKIGLPDAILQKPGPLGKTELAEIRTHPEIGAQILSGRGLEDLRDWVLAHHERPDGKGYPRGLPDGEIPLEAKILAVADAYEAMIADRVYRAGVDERVARAELLRCSGEQFDSRVVAAFLTVLNRADASRSSVRDVEVA
jgi:diguanylate cyclase (GGDEF)-like protein/putative nucleotidyltransferase with HDIG domain